MSALGQKRRFERPDPMSALHPKADIGADEINVRFAPLAPKVRCSQRVRYSITSLHPATRIVGWVTQSGKITILMLSAVSWQFELKNRSPVGSSGHPDLTVVALDDRLTDR